MCFLKHCKVTVNKRKNKKNLFFFVFIAHRSYFWILFSIFAPFTSTEDIVFTQALNIFHAIIIHYHTLRVTKHHRL